MPLILHQVLKDARLLRWLLVAWAVLLVGIHAVLIVLLHVQSIDRDALFRLSVAETLFVILSTAVFITTAASLVQHDSPVSGTAFWLTRPVSSRAMLASKLLFALVVMVVVPLLLDALDFAVAGLSLRWLPPQVIVFQLAWLLPVIAVAALTIGLPQFLLITLFEIVLFSGVTSVAYSLGFRLIVSPLPVMAAGMALLGALLFSYLYLTRHLRSSAVLFGVAPVLLFAAVAVAAPSRAQVDWPWGDDKDYPEASRSGISVTLDRSSLAVIVPGGITLEAPLTITGLPPDRKVFVSARWWYDTASVRLPLHFAYAQASQADVVADGERLLKDVLGGATLVNPREVTASRPALRAWMTPAEFDRVKDMPGTLHADLSIGAYRYQTEVVVPLKAGTTFEVGATRAEVLALTPGNSALSVVTRRAASGWFDMAASPNVFLLRSRHLGQAVVGAWSGDRRSFGGDSSSPSLARMFMPVPLHLSVAWTSLEFNFLHPGATSSRAAEWLQDAELVVASRPSAGRWRATIDLPNIKLGDIPTRRPAK